MRENARYFSEYRPKDYRTPRSMREACGQDCTVYYCEEPQRSRLRSTLEYLAVAAGAVAILLWIAQ